MSQFSMYKNENKNSKKAYPYFVDVQNDLLNELNSRIVIPLALYKTLKNINAKKLCPVIDIKEGRLVLLTQQMTTVPKSILKKEIVSLEAFRYEILGAIDLLITGI